MPIIEALQIVPMEQGGNIALHHCTSLTPSTQKTPLIITHGTLSNVDSVRGLAHFLVEMGFDCWLLDWGGHGHSTVARHRQNFEYPAMHDVPTALKTVLDHTNQPNIFWVSHSGGGHLALMYLARHPDQQPKFAGIVTMGAQATDATMRPLQKVGAGLLWLVTMLLARTPHQTLLPAGTEGEPSLLLAQWASWNIRERWLGADRFDYMQALQNLLLPALMIVGGNDNIAPLSGCQKLFDALGSRDKTWQLCAQSTGFSKDFTHGQLVLGRAAKAELFPKIGAWLETQAAQQQRRLRRPLSLSKGLSKS